MNLLFFDTETTGLPKDWKAPMSKVDNWPRVIQLAWLLVDEYSKEQNRGKYLIKPDGWLIPTGKFWIDNGFSQAESMASGVPLDFVFPLFQTALSNADCIVSHNMAFDYNVLGAEMIRAGVTGKKVERICTKEVGTDFCKMPAMYGGYKWPKLIELHKKLFNRGFDGAHDALADVIACKDCFFELVKRGVIRMPVEDFSDIL